VTRELSVEGKEAKKERLRRAQHGAKREESVASGFMAWLLEPCPDVIPSMRRLLVTSGKKTRLSHLDRVSGDG
jgi:hypothetical protein